ncbi:MAG TPA: transcription termination/antitermination protein NusG, partial [Hyphomonadaceae bacterium]|nr:transcription termination/antitermination protein NusG [Hyphomonadaceae bacterium]
RKRTVEKRHMPGYVLVKMKMTDEAYHLVKNTPKVTGFLGAEGGKKPLPVPQSEVDRILGKIESGTVERARPRMQFEIGEKIKVNEGPFAGFEGAVDSIDESTGRLKVTVTIFGRSTPVDLEYGQVDKI